MSKNKKSKTTSTLTEFVPDVPVVDTVDLYEGYECIGHKDGIQYLKNGTGFFYVNPKKKGTITGIGNTLSPELKAQLA